MVSMIKNEQDLDFGYPFSNEMADSPYNEQTQPRQRLKPWLIDQLNNETCPGCSWLHKEHGFFRLVWKHYGRPGYNEERDAKLFREWAIHTRRYNPGDPSDVSTWKTRFRNALHKMRRDVEEVTSLHQLDGEEPFRVYRFRSEDEVKQIVEASKIELSNINMNIVKSQKNQEYQEIEQIKRSLMQKFMESKENRDVPSQVPPIQGNMSTNNNIMVHNSQQPPLPIDEHLSIISDYLAAGVKKESPPKTVVRVNLYLSGDEVKNELVDSSNGIRIASKLPPLPADFVYENGNQEIFTEVFGRLDAHQIYFSQSTNDNANSILGAMERGLVIETAENGDIYGTRLCKARVFFNYDMLQEPIQLERHKKTLLFDFQNVFLPMLEKFKHQVGLAPPCEIFFSFGQRWSHHTPLKEMDVYCSLTHVLAKQLITEVKNFYPKENLISSDGFYDHLKDRIKNIALNVN